MTVLLAALAAVSLVVAGMAVVNALREPPMPGPERILLAALACAGCGLSIAVLVLS